MKKAKKTACAAAPEACGAVCAAELTGVTRIMRAARGARGDTNVRKIQPVDDAAWLWMPGDDGRLTGFEARAERPNPNKFVKFVKFRKTFEVKPGEGPLVIDVSADERFHLTIDGAFIARGPNRSTVENWQYQTYSVTLAPGVHTLAAVVWLLGDLGPLAQLSWRGGFILKADSVFDERLTTGKAKWEVGWLGGIRAIGIDNGVWGTGNQFEMTGAGPYAGEPSDYVEAVVVRGPAGTKGPHIYGLRTPGWMLFPAQLPDQTEKRVAPGLFRAVARGTVWRENRTWSEAETTGADVDAFNRLIQSGEKLVIPARTRLQAIWDLGRYHCAYPEVTLAKGGSGARVAWTWTESPRDPATGRKGDRGALVCKVVQGYGDEFISDGKGGVFSAPWFRCGRWCRLDVATGDEPLEIENLTLIASRYPLEMESIFMSPDDASLEGVRRICARAMQMCAHEMLFDCPYYEQQMYPGDTRVQLNVIRAMTRDDRLIKRAIEIYDLATRDDGMCPMNFPTRGLQESLTYTLCYLCMYGDYVMNHTDRAWLAARIPGLRKSMAGVERYENAEGLIEDPAGWSFMDWVPEWGHRSGVAPDGSVGEGVNAQNNLFWVLAMQSAAVTERALGHETMARYWDEKCAALKAKIIETFWSEERGLVADTVAKDDFSEHSQCLALLGDVLPAKQAKRVAKLLVEDQDLKRCTVYFAYYLFEAYFKIGRDDLFLKRLDLWRDYLKIGVTALLEAPEDEKQEARSDCHAWGAHPLWLMQAGLAGIRSAAPFFAKVCVAPQPGSLSSFTATHPHPEGEIRVKLAFAEGRATGTVETPVPGDFVYGDQKLALKPGVNAIK